MVSGMNKFLKLMDITFRRDPDNFRPRINKANSQKDQQQKKAGNYFLMDDKDEKARKAREAAEREVEFKKEELKLEKSRKSSRRLKVKPARARAIRSKRRRKRCPSGSRTKRTRKQLRRRKKPRKRSNR